ncbi:GNAT family N-acetyltransferase [Chitinibacteraceae bacterium HSL-7]
MYTLIDCSEPLHGDAIAALLNDAILKSTAIYDDTPRDAAAMRAWFAAKVDGGFPVIGAIDEAGTLLGFASYGVFRTLPGYRFTVEHAIYLAEAARGRGLGRVLLDALVARAQSQGRHMMVGVIDVDNTASIALHQRAGFTHAGTLKEAGFKFGRWLDVAFYQKMLKNKT